MKIYIKIYSVEMEANYVEGWFAYEEGTNLLEILRDQGLEIPDGQTACSVIKTSGKKTAFVKDAAGFKFVCTFRTAT